MSQLDPVTWTPPSLRPRCHGVCPATGGSGNLHPEGSPSVQAGSEAQAGGPKTDTAAEALAPGRHGPAFL